MPCGAQLGDAPLATDGVLVMARSEGLDVMTACDRAAEAIVRGGLLLASAEESVLTAAAIGALRRTPC